MIARLLDSVAPLVQTISLVSHLRRLATFARAVLIRWSLSQPKECDLEAGFPKAPSSVRHSDILSATRLSTGVVDE